VPISAFDADALTWTKFVVIEIEVSGGKEGGDGKAAQTKSTHNLQEK